MKMWGQSLDCGEVTLRLSPYLTPTETAKGGSHSQLFHASESGSLRSWIALGPGQTTIGVLPSGSGQAQVP